MSAPDISREACERLAEDFDTMRSYHKATSPEAAWHENAAATLRALRAALDAAERERNAAIREIGNTAREATAAADATGYARGVRDASCFYADGGADIDAFAAARALLPTTETKETRDDQ
jgi:hypothetical protein